MRAESSTSVPHIDIVASALAKMREDVLGTLKTVLKRTDSTVRDFFYCISFFDLLIFNF